MSDVVWRLGVGVGGEMTGDIRWRERTRLGADGMLVISGGMTKTVLAMRTCIMFNVVSIAVKARSYLIIGSCK